MIMKNTLLAILFLFTIATTAHAQVKTVQDGQIKETRTYSLEKGAVDITNIAQAVKRLDAMYEKCEAIAPDIDAANLEGYDNQVSYIRANWADIRAFLAGLERAKIADEDIGN